MESAQAQKLERQLAKVERKRWSMQVLSAVQILLGPPHAVWILFINDASSSYSPLSIFVAVLGLLWTVVGFVGLYAVSMRRVQALVVFTTLEIMLTMLMSCESAVLLLLHHLNCWVPQPALVPAANYTLQPWLRCPNVGWLLAASAAMVLYLAAAASQALALRIRIQKTGKRNLSWNQKTHTRRERNVRRGASAALRSLAPHLKDGDSRVDEDVTMASRLEPLATPLRLLPAHCAPTRRAAKRTGAPQVPRDARQAVHPQVAAAALPRPRCRILDAPPATAQPAQGLPQAR